MQRTDPFTFKRVSFSEEAEENLSSHSNPYNWQANLATASDGSSFAQVRVFRIQISHPVSEFQLRRRLADYLHCRNIEGLDADLDG